MYLRQWKISSEIMVQSANHCRRALEKHVRIDLAEKHFSNCNLFLEFSLEFGRVCFWYELSAGNSW